MKIPAPRIVFGLAVVATWSSPEECQALDLYCCDIDSPCIQGSCDGPYAPPPTSFAIPQCLAQFPDTKIGLSCQGGLNPPPCGSSPENPCGGGGGGDPHFQTWSGAWFDFHGECDLMLLDVPNFRGVGLQVQVRTTLRYDYSFIEAAAVRIGSDILEVSSYGLYALNGIVGADLSSSETILLGGYPVLHRAVSKKEHVFEVILGSNDDDLRLTLGTFKDLVSVKADNAISSDFDDGSRGLMGQFGTGKRFARDGQTTLDDDDNAFGQEWQLSPDEPQLFSSDRPRATCILPTSPASTGRRRRLGQTIAREVAEAACAHRAGYQEQCIFDVMATGDLEMAQAGAF